LQHGRRLQLDAVAVAQAEAVLQIAVAMQHRVVIRFGNAAVAQTFLELVHLGLDGEELGEGAAGFLEHRMTGVSEPVLGQVAHGQGGRFQNGAAVRLVEAPHHAQQRRLAGAVGTAQADALAIGNLPRDVVEQHAVAE
jgi:hypothetical protein